MIIVKLTRDEIMSGCEVGVDRRISSDQDNLRNNRYDERSDLAIDIEGACAELALCKYLGVPWNKGVRTYKLPDVGEFEVRCTSHVGGHLIVRPKDFRPDVKIEKYVLVVSMVPRFGIAGWFWKYDAKDSQYKYRDGTWWIPQSELKSMDTLHSTRERQETLL